MVNTDHHSDKIATTTNLLTSAKRSTQMKKFSLNYQQLYTTHMYVHRVYKEFPRHCLSKEIKDHKFWKPIIQPPLFKTWAHPCTETLHSNQ